MQAISRNAGLQKRLLQYMGMTMELAPELQGRIGQEMESLKLPQTDPVMGLKQKEHAFVRKARQQAQAAAQPH